MKFYRYWARSHELIDGPTGKQNRISYGYSNQSLEDALKVARERAVANASPDPRAEKSDQQYYAGQNPLREEIINELAMANGEKVIISRNRYGSLVLNTSNVFFADIDQPENEKNRSGANEGLAGFFGSLFGLGSNKHQKVAVESNGFEKEIIEKIETVINRMPNLVVRLYRTRNGFRLMIMNETIPCNLAKSNELLNAFGSDRLYVSLCRSQDCYRARLTPKPWRCGSPQPPVSIPYSDDSERQKFEKWLDAYEKNASRFATCALIGSFGHGSIDDSCQQIAELHDNFALNGELPLA